MEGFKHPFYVDAFQTLEGACAAYPHVDPARFIPGTLGDLYNHPTAGLVREFTPAPKEETMAKMTRKAQTKPDHAQVAHQQRLYRDFPGIEEEVDCLFYKHDGADTRTRLKLLWQWTQERSINFGQFERLLALIHCPDRIG